MMYQDKKEFKKTPLVLHFGGLNLNLITSTTDSLLAHPKFDYFLLLKNDVYHDKK